MLRFHPILGKYPAIIWSRHRLLFGRPSLAASNAFRHGYADDPRPRGKGSRPRNGKERKGNPTVSFLLHCIGARCGVFPSTMQVLCGLCPSTMTFGCGFQPCRDVLPCTQWVNVVDNRTAVVKSCPQQRQQFLLSTHVTNTRCL